MSQHTPDARLQPSSWTDGELILDWDPDGPWEVICEDCGDDRGPYERQPEFLKKRRGPYRNIEDARAAAIKHMLDT